MSATSVLARKWRPKTFAELAGQEHVVRALVNALDQDRLHHAYLFTGTRGVGKTTIARIFAKSLNCETGVTSTPCGTCRACTEIDSGRFVDLIELDAASNTQVDNMRELLESALYAPTSGRFKVYIIDEVHMLSKSAFNAMLKTLEEPPAHVKFILATTDPQKIPVTVLSRCLQFNLKQLPPALIVEHLQHVLEQEGIEFEYGALQLLGRAAQGSMRDALSLLDQAIAYAQGKIVESVVRTMLGAIDQDYLYRILEALLTRDGARLIEIADEMQGRSMEFEAALQEFATLLHRIALVQAIPQAIADDEPERPQLVEFSGKFGAEDLQLFYQIAIHGRNEIALAPDEYAGFTMTLLRMLAFMPGGDQLSSRTVVAAPVAAQPVSGPVVQAAGNSQIDWNILLSQLSLQGTAKELAKNCTLESFVDGLMKLRLGPQHKQLNSKMAQGKLQAALDEYFAQPVKLTVSIEAIDSDTPAELDRRQKSTRQQEAVAAITQDPFVRDAQAQLGAKVIEDSIKPV